MKVSQVEQEQSQVVLSIEVEPSEVEEHLEGVYRRVVQRTNIPGFRKGKAPRTVVERYLGRALLDQALDSLLPSVTSRAIQEQNLDVVATPRVRLAQEEPLIIEATVAIRPPVELGDYRQIRLEPEEVVVTQEQVDEVVESLRQRTGTWEPVERPVERGDLVTLEVQGVVEGEAVMDEKGVDYVILADSPNPVPGFAEKLVGAGIGERLEFAMPFPADYPHAELAEKECHFTVTVLEAKERKLPEVNDEFARSLDMKVESLAQLRERLEENLRQQSQSAANYRFEDQVVEALVERAQVKLPPLLVEEEVEHILSEQAEALRRWQVSMEAYLANVGKSVEQLRVEASATAVERITRNMVLQEVVRREGIEVTPEELEERLGSLEEESDPQGGSLRRIGGSQEGRRYVSNMLLTRKTLERLTQIAKGEAALEPSSAEETSTEEVHGESEGGV